MATVLLQAFDRCEGGLDPPDGIAQAKPAEFPRAGDGQKIEPDVGGRCAMGYQRFRIFLEIVRRQHAVRRGDESLKKPPCPAGNHAQDFPVVRRGFQLIFQL